MEIRGVAAGNGFQKFDPNPAETCAYPNAGAGRAAGRLMGEAGSKPEPVLWSGTAGKGQLAAWLAVKGRGAKKRRRI